MTPTLSPRAQRELADLDTCRRTWTDDSDPAHAFTVSERRQYAKAIASIEAHLRGVLDGQALTNAVLVIGCAVREAIVFMGHEDELRAANGAIAEQAEAIAQRVSELRALFDVWRPQLGLSSRIWNGLLPALEAVGNSAQAHVVASRQHQARRRGRPPCAWRDRLIATVYEAFPSQAAKRRSGSPFEQTVEILLNTLDPDSCPEDVHDAVLDVLKRNPAPYRVV